MKVGEQKHVSAALYVVPGFQEKEAFSSPDVLPLAGFGIYTFVLRVYKKLQTQQSAVSNSTLKCSRPPVACLSELSAPSWEDAIIGSNFTF